MSDDDHSGQGSSPSRGASVDVQMRGTEEGYEIPMTMSQNRREFVINGRYRVFNQLGEGGFATVYRGVDENLDRPVAIKIMRAELLSDSNREAFLGRFKREAFVVAKLDHPHLTPVYETGVLEQSGSEVAYIIMKQLVGEDLEEVLQRDGSMDPERVLLLMRQIIEALSYVHSKGITHKDLKPSNIFVSEDHLGREHAYLMDFGIAHDDRDAAGRMTSTGMLTGTFQYLPPEYIMNNEATPSIDVFQIGMILYELLTGKQLNDHTVTLPLIVARYLREEPYELDAAFAGTRGGEFLAKTLDYDLSVRHVDASELLAEFMTLKPEDFPSFENASAVSGYSPTEVDAPPAMSLDTSPSSRPMFESPNTVPESHHDVVRPSDTADAPKAAVLVNDYDEDTQGRGVVWLGVGVAIAIVACLAVIAVLQSGDESAGEELEVPAAGVTASSPAVVAEAPTEIGPERAAVNVNTIPAGATIRRDGKKLGTTPQELTFDADEEVTLKFVLAGHAPREETFRAGAHTRVEVALVATPEVEAEPVAKKSAATARPRKKVRPAVTDAKPAKPKVSAKSKVAPADAPEATTRPAEEKTVTPPAEPAKPRRKVTLPPR